jgi:hypothetical protein
VVADVGGAGQIVEVYARTDLYSPIGDSLGMDAWGYSKIYKPFGPRSIDSTVPAQIPEFALQTWLLEQCNANVDKLRELGMADNEIWALDREIDLQIRLRYWAHIWGPGGGWFPKHYETDKLVPAKLRCQRYIPSETPSTGGVTTLPCPDERVVNAKLLSEGIASLGGTCKLVLNYAIYTSCPNMEVKFKLHEQKRDVWSDVITTISNGFKLAVGRLEYDLANEAGAEIGEVRMHVISPNEFLSNHTDYTLICHEPGTGPIGLTAGAPQTPRNVPSFGVRIDDVSAASYESPDKLNKGQ